MSISWTGDLNIADKGGSARVITSMPRDGMNPQLALCGQSYGVIKAKFSNDPPHWSDDGH